MPDSRLLIVVEGKTDARAIRAILGTELVRRTRFFAAQGRRPQSSSLMKMPRYFTEGGPSI